MYQTRVLLFLETRRLCRRVVVRLIDLVVGVAVEETTTCTVYIFGIPSVRSVSQSQKLIDP